MMETLFLVSCFCRTAFHFISPMLRPTIILTSFSTLVQPGQLCKSQCLGEERCSYLGPAFVTFSFGDILWNRCADCHITGNMEVARSDMDSDPTALITLKLAFPISP